MHQTRFTTASSNPFFLTAPAMEASNFSLSTYLQRIAFQGDKVIPDLTGLQELMRLQLFAIPFENLDVQAKKIVSLVPEDIVEKIIFQQRGGYCYEVNGLFSMALHALGVEHFYVACRPMYYPVRRPKTHMALIVTLDGKPWLFDLGFGGNTLRAPIALAMADEAAEIIQGDDRFKLSKTEKGEYLLQALTDGAWSNQYAFDLYPQEWIDFVPANYLNSSHPDAFFVQRLLVAIQHPSGRSILLDDTLKIIEHGEVTQRSISVEQRPAVLAQVFGLRPPE